MAKYHIKVEAVLEVTARSQEDAECQVLKTLEDEFDRSLVSAVITEIEREIY